MHSRIIELSKDPILKHERMCESSVPDWFYHSIADYTDADTDRDHDIKWFLDAVARVVDVAEDGKSFTFKPKAKQKYFERQYHAFLDSLICSGKGNEDWNCSAPHGAGRLMSRKAAFNALSMEEFQKEMEGIYTTCVVPDTLDESPMAYKSMEEIVAQIGPTAEIIERIRPVYNFKAAD